MSNNEALDDKTVQALTERLGWEHPGPEIITSWHLAQLFYNNQDGECMADKEEDGWHLTLAGVAACIEGLELGIWYNRDYGWIVMGKDNTEAATLTATVTAAVKEMFK